MKKFHFISLLLILLFQHVLAQNPFVTNYTIEDGLPSNKVYCVFQDSKNFMWFGTDDGVVRYDGTNIIHYEHEDGLSDYSVIRIKEDLSGRLWLLNFNGTVNYILNNKVYNDTNSPFLREIKSNQIISDFYQDPRDSLIYFYSITSEVFVLKDDEIYDYRKFTLDNEEEITLFQIQKTQGNDLILWSNMSKFKTNSFNGKLKQVSYPVQLQKTIFTNTNYIATIDNEGFLCLYDDEKLIQKDIIRCSSVHVNSILIDQEGFIWISTFDKGIYCYKEGTLVLELDIKLAQTLIEDQENNIWACSLSGGVYKINRNILKFGFLDKSNFDNRGITAVTRANDGGVWVSNGTSITKLKNDELYQSNISVNSQVINQLYQCKNNKLFAKGTSTGLFVIDKINSDDKQNSVTCNDPQRVLYSFNKLIVDQSEEYIFSYVNDEAILIRLNVDYKLSRIPLRKGRIRNIALNRHNNVIVNTLKNYSLEIHEDLFEQNESYTISVDSTLEKFDGKKMISQCSINDKFDLYNFEGNQLVLQSDGIIYDGLLDSENNQIDHQIKDLFYSDSTLFFSTTKTVYYISNPLNIVDNKPIKLNRINIDFKSINNIYCAEGKLYIASIEGLTYIPVSEIVHSPAQPPTPYIYKVITDDKPIDLSSNQIEYKNKARLSIEFSSLNYSSIPSEYSYRMKGLDTEWSSGHETRVVYLNLDPGEYTFQIKSRKNKEQFGEIIELPVVVHPTILQRTSSKIALLVLLLMLLSLIIRAIYRRKIKQKETDHLLISLEHKALQSMMNPHFIFNALGSIQGYLLQNKSSEAGTYLSQFARLIRQNMNSLKSNYICIDDEVERLRNYIDLEKLRMNNRFDFEIYVDENIDSYEVCIPSMTVQPFIENAIWHGISTIEDGGKIKVTFNSLDEKSIEVIVEDNGVGIENSNPTAKSGHGLNMGMNLTKKRLRLIGERYGVTSEISSKNISNDPDWPGTQIKIIIPIVDGES
ncbi:histidine kinase [uncultured Draconibacterium sp.]|uniref:sensor histidine kinase n=1 Tax=uncultured Draconibacterium sp. TaxID=1573823 RepID=UPI003217FCC7